MWIGNKVFEHEAGGSWKMDLMLMLQYTVVNICYIVCVCVCPAFTEQEPAYYTNGLSYMLEGRVKFMRPHKVRLRFIFLGEWPVKDSWLRVSTQSTSEPNAYVKYLNVHFVTIPFVPLYWMN